MARHCVLLFHAYAFDALDLPLTSHVLTFRITRRKSLAALSRSGAVKSEAKRASLIDLRGAIRAANVIGIEEPILTAMKKLAQQ